MDRFHLMSVYVAVAEAQGFASAARRLDMSPPAVTRAVAALEQRLGAKLLNRTTRLVRTTEIGQRYLEDARRVLAEADAADEAVAGINAEPRGHLAVTVPVLFGRMFVIPATVEYLRRFPQMEVSAQLLDRNVNLLEEGIDVGIRIGELPDSSMRALRVGSVRRVACASPKYLQQHGIPQTPADLLEHSLIASSAASNILHWRFNRGQGRRLQPRLTVSTNDAAIEAALCDFGITRLLSYQVATLLANGELQTVLAEFEPDPWPIHIVHREGRYTSARVRSYIDFIAERLRADPTLQ